MYKKGDKILCKKRFERSFTKNREYVITEVDDNRESVFVIDDDGFRVFLIYDRGLAWYFYTNEEYRRTKIKNLLKSVK